jgi:16S rRNA (cytidine1402-2'-O)-methyltransferase
MGKHESQSAEAIKLLNQGISVGVISEAGCPGVADPGSEVVALAQSQNIKVVPLVGPSSILLALMASGFNGQGFSFNGYLPIDPADKQKKLKQLDRLAAEGHTQIFIETPFRNTKVLGDLMQNCSPSTLLCIACDITLATEFIQTKSIADWKKKLPDINKRPAIFLLYKG